MCLSIGLLNRIFFLELFHFARSRYLCRSTALFSNTSIVCRFGRICQLVRDSNFELLFKLRFQVLKFWSGELLPKNFHLEFRIQKFSAKPAGRLPMLQLWIMREAVRCTFLSSEHLYRVWFAFKINVHRTISPSKFIGQLHWTTALVIPV